MVTKFGSRASGPAAPASTPHADKPINVLILGETANGKSTLIRRLGTYSGNEAPDVVIGNGNESCTKTVASHPVSTRLHSYSLIDTLGEPLKCSTYDDLLDLTWEDASQAQGMPDENGKTFQFDFFDTPGLDDSGGNDVAIMADIIRNITALPHLNAIIYVRSMDQPFGRAFRTWYDYLERCMPMLCRGMIVVHSRCTTNQVADFMSRRVNLMEDRRKAFEAATGGHNRNAHFFMDNEPDPYSPFSVVQSLNACYQLLKLLSKQRPLDISNIQLFKSPNMNRLDGQAALALGRVQDRLRETLARKMADASKSKQDLELAKREVNRFRRKLDHCDAELARLDNDHEVLLGTKSVQDDYSIIQDLIFSRRVQLPKREASFHAACDIRHVVTSTEPGSQWVDEERSPRRWSAKLKAGLFSSMAGSATFYSTNRIMHSREIERLQGTQTDLAYDLEGYENTVKSESGKGVKLDGDVEELAAELDKVERMKETLEQKSFDATLWPDLRKLYTSADNVGTNEVVELVKVYDPSTALLITKHL
ncbi:hypothetical protein MAPG_09843 [Magnaporthiopsis poae ATCC 64411]|uniref:G domain-containing protein n=1 Tax=Magnaporthiopsis poae (strain ATCC 64411 / 73-15) TaxID=644358 RepID=A0A0C4EB03_MAGP6|nr:hypothetical protein MAPG_09843 [Magnaporthiopsis poae ATCC 64411]